MDSGMPPLRRSGQEPRGHRAALGAHSGHSDVGLHLDSTVPLRDSWDLSGVMDSMNALDNGFGMRSSRGLDMPASNADEDDASKILRTSLESMTLDGDAQR